MLEATRQEMAVLKKQKRRGTARYRTASAFFSDYADKYLEFHWSASDSGKKARTMEREGHSLVQWKDGDRQRAAG